MEETLKSVQALFNYYTDAVNNYRAREDYTTANEYMSMLCGAMSMYNALSGAECTLDDVDGRISVTVYEED